MGADQSVVAAPKLLGPTVRGEFRDQMQRDVAAQMPRAVALFATMISVGTAIEAYHFPDRLGALAFCIAVFVLTCGSGIAGVWRWPRHAASVTLATVSGLAATLALYLALIHNSGELCLLAMIGYLTGVVVQFPWGVRYQAAAAAIVGLTFSATYAIGTQHHLPVAYGMFAMATHAIMTVLGAALLDRYRWSAFREAAEAERLAAEAARANQAKSDFLATVSHELRTPLNIIFGYTDLLLEDAFADSEERGDALRRIRAQSGNLLDMIQAMLDISKLESGGVQIVPLRFRLRDLMARLAAAIPESWCKRGVELRWDPVAEDVELCSDPDKIEIVVRNLIHNALKYTEAGQVRVGAKLSPARDSVEFAIADTGQGIPPDDLDRIFEMFQQSSSAPPRQGGVGLGLFLVKRLTTALGGTIRADSQVGRGSRFTVTLPIGVPADEDRQPVARARTYEPALILTTSKADEVPV